MTLIIPSDVATVMTVDVRRWLPDVSRSSARHYGSLLKLNLHTADIVRCYSLRVDDFHGYCACGCYFANRT